MKINNSNDMMLNKKESIKNLNINLEDKHLFVNILIKKAKEENLNIDGMEYFLNKFSETIFYIIKEKHTESKFLSFNYILNLHLNFRQTIDEHNIKVRNKKIIQSDIYFMAEQIDKFNIRKILNSL